MTSPASSSEEISDTGDNLRAGRRRGFHKLGLLWFINSLVLFALSVAMHPTRLTFIAAPSVFAGAVLANLIFIRVATVTGDQRWELLRNLLNGPLAFAAILATGGLPSPVWMASYQCVIGSMSESSRNSILGALFVIGCHVAAYALCGTAGSEWITVGGRCVLLLGLCLFFRIIFQVEQDHRDAAEESARAAERARAARKDSEARFRIAEQSATHSRMASLGLLAASVAHEINNPINTIINSSQIILDGDADSAGGAERFQRLIISEGERIARVVSNLLQFARGGGEDYGPISLRRTVEKTLMLINYQLDKDSIRVELDLPRDLPSVRGRMEELQQVFLNLITNARYAVLERKRQTGPSFTASIGIGARASVVEGELAVVVRFRDNGTGIPADHLPHIFDPFFTTKPKEEGTGLGLSVCSRIVKEHRGRLQVASTTGEGAQFTLTFPAVTEHTMDNTSGVQWTAVVPS